MITGGLSYRSRTHRSTFTRPSGWTDQPMPVFGPSASETCAAKSTPNSVPGIGNRPLSSIRPNERTTPAGRFEAALARDPKGEELLWVDYDTSVSLHRVVKGHPSERRAERLAAPTPKDNRISYGCINVPVEFYESHIQPAFAKHRAAVYILPEVKPLEQVFGLPAGGASG